MNDFDVRRLRAAIRPGHVVTTPDETSLEVEYADDTWVRVTYNNPAAPHKAEMCRRTHLALSADQITPDDDARLQGQERGRRSAFLKTLPPALRHYTFDNLVVHEGNQRATDACKNLSYGTNLMLYGGAGNGKTMLAVAVAHHLAAYYSVTFWGVVDLFKTIKASFNAHAGVERPNLQTPEVLVLDDIGKSKATDFVYEELYGLINYRWENGKTTLFTSNHSARATAQKVSPDPDNAGALLSRMASGDVVEVRGRDQRALQGRVGKDTNDS